MSRQCAGGGEKRLVGGGRFGKAIGFGNGARPPRLNQTTTITISSITRWSPRLVATSHRKFSRISRSALESCSVKRALCARSLQCVEPGGNAALLKFSVTYTYPLLLCSLPSEKASSNIVAAALQNTWTTLTSARRCLGTQWPIWHERLDPTSKLSRGGDPRSRS